MLSRMLRTAALTNLRFQTWLLKRAIEAWEAFGDPMSQPPPSVKRRKKAPEPTVPAAETLSENGIHVEPESAAFFTQHPLMESRRRFIGQPELTHLLASGLLKAGMPAELLAHTRWLWVSNRETGTPELYLILPGIDA